MKFGFVLLLASLLGVFLFGMTGLYAAPLGFASCRFDPAVSGEPHFPEILVYRDVPSDGDVHYIAQFGSPISRDMRDSLLRTGARITGYVPDFAFAISASGAQIAAVKEIPGIVYVGVFHPAFKLPPDFQPERIGDFLSWEEVGDIIEVNIQAFPDAEIESLENEIETIRGHFSIDGSCCGHRRARFHVLIPREEFADTVYSIARIQDVEWIEYYKPPELFNDVARWVVQSYQDDYTPIWDHGIKGENQIVGIGDTGVDADMCFFYDDEEGLPDDSVNNDQRKIIAYYDLAGNGDWDAHGHGTHTSCSIAGDNSANENAYDENDGIAYNAKLVFQDIGRGSSLSLPDDLYEDYFLQAFDAGAKLHSNSWGWSYWDEYSVYCQDSDAFMWDHKDFLILFSAGNDGPYGYSIGNPACAKSILTSGATENAYTYYDPENMAYFSSHGPVADGRRKPTVSAPGYEVDSAMCDYNIGTYNCDTWKNSGTSMSCPIHAGCGALVRQYFVDGFYPSGEANASDSFIPSNALLKAVLVNCAQNMTGYYTDGDIPSNGQGWGRVRLDNTLHFSDDDLQLIVVDETTGLSTSEDTIFEYQVDGSSRLEVTLVWTDYPGEVYSNPSLVNDLDLVVSGPSGTFKGSNYESGQSKEGGSADHLNPVESVQINSPEAGSYTITVTGYNVPEGPQSFALVVIGASEFVGGPWPMFMHDGSHTCQGEGDLPGSAGVKWSYQADGTIRSSAIIDDDGAICFGSGGGKLYFLDEYGSLKSSYNAGSAIVSTPSFYSGGDVFFGAENGKVYAVRSDGTLKWTYDTGSSIASSPVIGDSGRVYIGAENGKLYSLSNSGGLEWSHVTSGAVVSSPAIGADGLIRFSSGDGKLRVLDSSGSLVGSYQAPDEINSSPSVAEQGVCYFGCDDGYLYAVDSGGSLSWSRSIGAAAGACSPAIDADGNVYIGTGGGRISKFNSYGTLRWSYSTGSAICGAPAVGQNGRISFGTESGYLYCLSSSGSLVWSAYTGSEITNSVTIGEGLNFFTGLSNGKMLSMTRSNADPNLENGDVNPDRGNKGTTFTFTVDYSDSDEDEPDFVYVYIDGSPHTMSLDSGNSYDGTYSYSTTLSEGDHEYYFYCEDVCGGIGRDPESGTYDGPSVNYSPTLTDGHVTPESGKEDDTFTYSVFYYDYEETAPIQKLVYIDGGSHGMTLYSGDAGNGEYRFETSLGQGGHEFYFYFTDQDGASARLPKFGAYDGPDVTDDYEPDDTCAESKSLPSDGSKQNRSIHPAEDIDWAELTAVTGGRYTIETSELDGCNTHLYLYDDDCETLITDDDDSGDGYGSKIEWNCGAGGSYFIKVIDSDEEGTGTYKLSAIV
ncbi:MAG: S8 family serine peptidase, partial [Candidatus Coatesbacteria bacterium]|nr:S8 family serine peptidase [Candidatus Coatesbacteria bacterium]